MDKIIYALIVQIVGISCYCRRHDLEQSYFERKEAWRIAWKFPPDDGILRKFNFWGICLISIFTVVFGATLFLRAIAVLCSPLWAGIAIVANIIATIAILARCFGKEKGGSPMNKEPRC